jgi:deoxyribose-phosphate aldolase
MDDLHSYIDYTYLQPVASIEKMHSLCEEAKKYRFASVCVHPYFLPIVRKQLQYSSIGIGTVVGFPLGANSTATKMFEAKDAISEGATELDMVINISALKEGFYDAVKEELYEIKQIARNQILKVILETCYLTHEEKIKACLLCVEAGCDFVKTSTGMGTKGATVEDVALLRSTVGTQLGVKASGGIRDRETAVAMIRAGATRIGTSYALQMMS